MGEICFITIQKIVVMFIFIATGFVMRRSKVLPEQSGKVMSMLVTKLFLPCLIFNNLSSNIKVETISEKLVSFLIGIGFLAATLLVARLFSLRVGKTKADKNLYTYIFAFSNYAYFGYPIIRGVFGAEMLSDTIIFAIPFTVTIFTYGVYLLTGGVEKEKKSAGKQLERLLSPVIVAVALGILCGFMPIRIPEMISEALVMSANCMSPVSMILTGFVLAAFPVKELFKSKAAYFVSFIRLAIIPAFFGIVLWLIGLRGGNYIIPVLISAMPVGLNVIVFTEANNKDSKNSARSCFVSYIMALITVPVVFGAVSSII